MEKSMNDNFSNDEEHHLLSKVELDSMNLKNKCSIDNSIFLHCLIQYFCFCIESMERKFI